MFPRPTTFTRTTTSTSTSSSFTGLSLFDTTQRAQMGSDLLYLFGSRSSTNTGSSSGSPSGSSGSAKTAPKVSTRPQKVCSEKEKEDERMFITWPESHILPGSRSRSSSPDGSESSSSSTISLSLPDYTSPNSSQSENLKSHSNKLSKVLRPAGKRRTQSEPLPLPLLTPGSSTTVGFRGRARSGSEASFTSSTTTLVDHPSYPQVDHPLFDFPTSSSGTKPLQLRISVEVEETISISSQAKWELDLDLPSRTSATQGGLRRNGPGGRGDRWNGNWV